MYIPTPKAPYDSLTANLRDKLFQQAQYLTEGELELLEKACSYAFFAHDGQKRKSGEPYITHPVSVATKLAQWEMDSQTLCAGLMHDVLEDTSVTKHEMITLFGQLITDIVDGVSKLEKLKYNSKQEQQADNLRKLISAVTKDQRVIIVKLADRLHNMQTLGAKGSSSRHRIATETLEIYAPIANRLGFHEIYRQLQDLSFKALHPNRYTVLQHAMENFKHQYQASIDDVLEKMKQRLSNANIEARVLGREKNLYNIYQKMISKHIKFKDVQDLYGFRVIVNSQEQCYLTLGVLHALYQPKPGRIKDYIAIPKSNGYQSLHTTLNGPHGLPIEVQIRTQQMHQQAEVRVATSHDSVNAWIQDILYLEKNSSNPFEFADDLKSSLLPKEIYVTTPNSKTITLPYGATPIDFAYAIHTDVGNHCQSARVNQNLVPLDTLLKTGDRVEIITVDQAHPMPIWLESVKSSRARSAIRAYLKNHNQAQVVDLGRYLLTEALSSLLPQKVIQSDTLYEKYLKQLRENKQQKLGEHAQEWSNDDLFNEILNEVGMGYIKPIEVAMKMAELAGHYFNSEIKLKPIVINGQKNLSMHLADCCLPVAGDKVSALIMSNGGLAIHRDNCAVLLKASKQILDAKWAERSEPKYYKTHIKVKAEDAQGLLAEVSSVISKTGADITAVIMPDTHLDKEGEALLCFDILVHDIEHLQQIITALEHIPRVRTVQRV